MNFISQEFFILLAVVLAWYYRAGMQIQNLILVAAGYVFYGWWDYRFCLLLFGQSVIVYWLGLVVGPKAGTMEKEKRLLLLGVAINLSLLGYFKYANFFIDEAVRLSKHLGFTILDHNALTIVLPIGISFYTFQKIAYLVDVHVGHFPACRNLLEFLVYVTFFPQMVAGPIERPAEFLPSVGKRRILDWENLGSGAELFMVGFLKKNIFSDNLSPMVDTVFNSGKPPGGFDVMVATLAFSFQIYGDFSGYTDMARGTARILGFSLAENFYHPYLARNPQDFWRRWHISLSRWFRDYLYIPLGGGRQKTWHSILNAVITMLLCGLWHGASWKFVLWGGYHGFLIGVHRLFTNALGWERTPSAKGDKFFWWGIIPTFMAVCLGWMIFRANDVDHMIVLVNAILKTPTTCNLLYLMDILRVLMVAMAMWLFDLWGEKQGVAEPWQNLSTVPRAFFYSGILYLGILLDFPKPQQFIYFQF